jgi:FAD binding domain
MRVYVVGLCFSAWSCLTISVCAEQRCEPLVLRVGVCILAYVCACDVPMLAICACLVPLDLWLPLLAHTLRAEVVVLTTGGFAADRSGFLREYAPQFANLCTTNGAFALGEGVRLARTVGAALVDMDQVQVHPTSFVHPARPSAHKNFLAPEALRGSGGRLPFLCCSDSG